MLSLTAKLSIGGAEIKGMSGAKLVSSLDTCMDTATIVLAAGKTRPGDFKEGDRVELSLGYTRYGLINEFSGVIESVSPKAPLEIVCADDFYFLRRRTINRYFERKPVADIIKQAADGYTTVFDSPAKQMRVSISCPGHTSRWLIAKCARDFGFLAFFRDKKLYFVKSEYLQNASDESATYEEGVNIYDDQLYYHRSQNIGKVTVCSESENGYLTKQSYGKKKPEKICNIEGIGASECWKRAKEIYEDINYEGFRGTVRTFGYPFNRAGLWSSLLSKNGEKSGVFRSDKVETEFGTSGFRRTIFLGQKHPTRQPVKAMTGRSSA